MRTVAALYVLKDGPYFGLPGVDPWDEARDARLYDGPHPVVAHPPCARWGRYWSGGPSYHGTKILGDDNGCFEAALASVQQWGGVLEHPEGTHAWKRFHIVSPPRKGGWVYAGLLHPEAWTCCVEQGHYGHAAAKATWLYCLGMNPPELVWGSSGKRLRLDDGFHSTEERRRLVRTGVGKRLSARQRAATPIPFRDLLISMARDASGEMGRLECQL